MKIPNRSLSQLFSTFPLEGHQEQVYKWLWFPQRMASRERRRRGRGGGREQHDHTRDPIPATPSLRWVPNIGKPFVLFVKFRAMVMSSRFVMELWTKLSCWYRIPATLMHLILWLIFFFLALWVLFATTGNVAPRWQSHPFVSLAWLLYSPD